MMTYLPHFTILIVAFMVASFYENLINTLNRYSLTEFGIPWKSPVLPWLIFFGYIALLAGMRSGMNDTSVYISSYLNGPSTWNEIVTKAISLDIKYVAWEFLQGLCRIILGYHYHRFFLLIACFESVLFVHTFRREVVDYMDACFFFFAAGYYYNYFSMMRQWLAVSIVFTSIGALKEKNFWKYALICFIGGLFHPSAWLCIPIYFLVQIEPFSIKQILITGSFAMAMLFMNPILSTMSESLNSSMYSYVVDTMAGNNGSSPIRFFITIVPVVLAFYNYTGNENATCKICINMAILNAMLNLLASITSGLYVIRFTTYIGIFNTILYPYLLNNGEDNKVIKRLFYGIYLIYFIYSTSHMQAWGYKSDVLTWLSNY